MTPLKQVRLYHLFLVVLATTAYLTGDEESGIHRLIGYGIAAAVSFRLLLAAFGVGLFGWRRLVPPLRAPAALPKLKHPAISRVLILLILAAVTGTATTGLLMDNGASLIQPSLTFAESGIEEGANGQEAEGEESEDGVLSDLHELLANLIIVFVGAHIFYLMIFRLPMAKFMVFWPTGKRDRKGRGANEEPIL